MSKSGIKTKKQKPQRLKAGGEVKCKVGGAIKSAKKPAKFM